MWNPSDDLTFRSFGGVKTKAMRPRALSRSLVRWPTHMGQFADVISLNLRGNPDGEERQRWQG